ncbi:hypothetical protein Tco_1377206 [Tanacetum coccineum]
MNYYEPNPVYDSNYSGFRPKLEPPQFPVIHQPPQEMSMEALQAREDLMKSIENFLKKFNRISLGKTPKVTLLGRDRYIFPGLDDSIPPGIESVNSTRRYTKSTSLPEFDSFHVDYPDSGDSTINVVEDIPVDVPNILPTHPTLHMDFFFFSTSFLLIMITTDHDVFFSSEDRKTRYYDLGICIEVESTRFLAPLSLVIDTLLPFSSENEDKVFNHDVLAYKEKYPPSSSHRGLKAFQLSPEIPMMIHGDNTPNLGVRHPHFYPP